MGEGEQLDEIEDLDVALLLQKTDRILSEDEKISVEGINLSGSIACADPIKSSIFLDINEVKRTVENVNDFIIMSKGLNYHELAHILFTDFSQTKTQSFLDKKYRENPKNYMRGDDFFMLLNLLEDCRIENFFYSEYPRAKYYFTFCALKLLLNKIKDFETDKYKTLTGYLVLYGRKFFDENIRLRIKALKNKIDKEKAEKGEKLIDRYITEIDLNKRFEIAYEFTLLITNNGNFVNPIKPDLLSSVQSIARGKPRKGTKKRNEKATEKIKEKIEKDKKTKSKNKSKDSDNKKETSKLLKDFLEKVVENIENNPSLQKEINSEVSKLTAGLGREYDSFSGEALNITSKTKFEINRIERILRELRGDLSTQIFRFQKKGKVDIISAIKSQKNGTLNVFRKEKLNKIDKSKLGVSFILDTSGSIRGDDFRNEIQATYSLTKALEKLNNQVEVIEFSDRYRILKSFHSQGDWKREFSGGTSIIPAFEQSVKDLIKLRRTDGINNLFAIIISDGCFNEETKFIVEAFRKARKQGIHILWIYASGDYGYISSRLSQRIKDLVNNIDWHIQIKSLEELAPKLKNIIKEIQRKINNKINNQGSFYA